MRFRSTSAVLGNADAVELGGWNGKKAECDDRKLGARMGGSQDEAGRKKQSKRQERRSHRPDVE
jgi:hypothetical protein